MQKELNDAFMNTPHDHGLQFGMRQAHMSLCPCMHVTFECCSGGEVLESSNRILLGGFFHINSVGNMSHCHMTGAMQWESFKMMLFDLQID